MLGTEIGSVFELGLILLLVGFVLPLVFLSLKNRIIRSISLILNIVAGILLIIFSAQVFLQKKTEEVMAYQILPALQLSFIIDNLSAFFIILIAIVSICVAIYSFSYCEHYPKEKSNFLVSMMNLFVLSMVAVVASKNMFCFLFFWEIMALSSFFLVMFDYESSEAKKAGMFYFVMTQLSTVFLLFAFIMLYKTSGSLNIEHVQLTVLSGSVIFIALFIGFGIKSGIIPFHKWLPYAHPASPSNISALMSGVMLKVAIYGLIRFLITVLDPVLWWGILILTLGTMSAILGVIYALKEHDIKRLLAYHSIENIGIILIGIGLYIIFSYYNLQSLALLSMAAALFHTLNHALFKSLLFLTAGSVVHETRTRNIDELGGLIKSMPYTAFLFLVGAVSISALPPFNGFVSELMLFSAFFQSGVVPDPFVKVFLVLCLSIFALTSALAAACFVKAFGMTFLALPRSDKAKDAKEVGFFMIAGPMIIALLCAGLGIFSYQIFGWLGYEFQLPNMLYIGLMLLAFYLVAVIIMYFVASRKVRVSETWGCGILSQNSKMEYTASGFSEPIVTIFGSIYQTKKISNRTFHDVHNANFKEGHAHISLMKFFEEYLYDPIIKVFDSIASQINKLQSNNIESYVAYVFAAIVILVILIGVFT